MIERLNETEFEEDFRTGEVYCSFTGRKAEDFRAFFELYLKRLEASGSTSPWTVAQLEQQWTSYWWSDKDFSIDELGLAAAHAASGRSLTLRHSTGFEPYQTASALVRTPTTLGVYVVVAGTCMYVALHAIGVVALWATVAGAALFAYRKWG